MDPTREERARILDTAKELINGDRNSSYGPPNDDFAKTAKFWSVYLSATNNCKVDIHPHDVAALMALLKISRIAWSPLKDDNWIDLAGYAACGWSCTAP